MSLDDNDLDSFLDAFEARTFTVKLDGVKVKELRGIWRRRTEFINNATQEIKVIPSAQCKESDLDDVTRSHTLTDQSTGTEYKIYGDFQPGNSGFSIVGLMKA